MLPTGSFQPSLPILTYARGVACRELNMVLALHTHANLRPHGMFLAKVKLRETPGLCYSLFGDITFQVTVRASVTARTQLGLVIHAG